MGICIYIHTYILSIYLKKSVLASNADPKYLKMTHATGPRASFCKVEIFLWAWLDISCKP